MKMLCASIWLRRQATLIPRRSGTRSAHGIAFGASLLARRQFSRLPEPTFQVAQMRRPYVLLILRFYQCPYFGGGTVIHITRDCDPDHISPQNNDFVLDKACLVEA